MCGCPNCSAEETAAKRKQHLCNFLVVLLAVVVGGVIVKKI